MKPKLLTAPVGSLISLEDAKGHARVFYNDDDGDFNAYIKAATSYLDGYGGILNRCLQEQTWRTVHRRFRHRMETLFTDTSAAVVKYYDRDGAQQTVPDTEYKVYPDYIRFNNAFVFPALDCDRDDPVIIESTHGYDVVPEDLLLAAKTLVTHWYRNRVPVATVQQYKVPFTVDTLIAPHRWAF